jgi:hypothetical protein
MARKFRFGPGLCSKCGQPVEVAKSSWCRACMAAYMRLKRTGSAEKRERPCLAYRCSKCGIALNEQTGRKNSHRKTGMSACCRLCDREDVRARRAANPEHARATDRAWNAANKEHVRKVKAAYASRRPEIRRKIDQKFHASKPTEFWTEKMRRWRAKNPDRWAHHSRGGTHRRRSRMNAIEATITAQDWLETLEVFDHRCAYCNGRTEHLEQEHVVAIARGGGHTAENIVPACRSCNAKKKDRPVWVMAGM